MQYLIALLEGHFLYFGSGCLWGAKANLGWPWGGKMAQHGAKMEPRWSHDGPRWSQDGSRWSQDGPRLSQDVRECAPRALFAGHFPIMQYLIALLEGHFLHFGSGCLWGAKANLGWPWGGKLDPRWLKMVPRWAKMTPTWRMLAPDRRMLVPDRRILARDWCILARDWRILVPDLCILAPDWRILG